MARGSTKAGKRIQNDQTVDEPKFPYTLELVATIAARFIDAKTSDGAAAERAVKFLDAVAEAIERKVIILRARKKTEQISVETPAYLEFAKGVRRISGKPTETEAVKAFRNYLRLNLRLSALGRPGSLTEEQVENLLEPLADAEATDEEDRQVQKIMTRYRKSGFNQVQIITIKRDMDWLQSSFVRRYQNSKKGKQGGRPRGKEKERKSLEREVLPKK
jgi:hypothetical protein